MTLSVVSGTILCVERMLCLNKTEDNRVDFKDFPPTAMAEEIDHTISLHLPAASVFSTFWPFLHPSFLFPVSLLLLPPLQDLVGGWSVTLLCAQWPVARWWFMALESQGLGDEVGGWLGLKSLVAVLEWWMNVFSTRQSKLSSCSIQQLLMALGMSPFILMIYPPPTHTHTHTVTLCCVRMKIKVSSWVFIKQTPSVFVFLRWIVFVI